MRGKSPRGRSISPAYHSCGHAPHDARRRIMLSIHTNASKNDKWSDFVVNSMGVCTAMPEGKKSAPLLVMAYAYADAVGQKQISFLTLPFPPPNKLYEREDFLTAVKKAEGVRNVTYLNTTGQPKDIYFCRGNAGKMIDVIPRDYQNNRFAAGFAEVCATKLKFEITAGADAVGGKHGKPFSLSLSASVTAPYEAGSYEYAAVNAYNACLLGQVFEREELQLETKQKKQIRVEVRRELTVFLDEGVLCVLPVFRDNDQIADYYETEEFNYIDGNDVYAQKYRITYTNRLNDYRIELVS